MTTFLASEAFEPVEMWTTTDLAILAGWFLLLAVLGWFFVVKG